MDSAPNHQQHGTRLLAGALAVCLAVIACLTLVIFEQQRKNAQQMERLLEVVTRLTKEPANLSNAEVAMSKGREAFQAGQWDLGQVYFVNAVTNDPRNLEHLSSYTTAALERDGVPREVLDRLSSVLQLASFQVDSDNVPKVLALVAQVDDYRKRQSGVGETGGTQAKDQQYDAGARWDRLSKVDVGVYKDVSKLAFHVQALQELVDDLEEEGAPGDLRSKALAELNKFTQIAQAVRQCGYVDACLERVAKEGDLSSQRAVAVVQAAENALPNFWGVDLALLPADLKSKIDAYPEKVQALVKRIGEARSAATMTKLREVLKFDTSKKENEGWEPTCLAIEAGLAEAGKLVENLSSKEARFEAQRLMEKSWAALKQCRDNQRYDYQRWVIAKSTAAFNEYQSYRFTWSEDAALKIFKDHVLAEVDQSVLSIEVSRMFNDVANKLMAKMGPAALVRTEKEMSEATKQKLENF